MTVPLPTGARANAYVEKLEALGCAYPTLRVLGPQSSGDLRAAVNWNEQSTACNAPEWLLDERTILLRPLPIAELRAEILGVPNDLVSLRGMAASLYPSFATRENRWVGRGGVVATEITVGMQNNARSWGYAISATPGFTAVSDFGSSTFARFYLQDFSLKLGMGFSELSFSRQLRRFGDTAHGALLYSAAAAPVDALEYSLRPVVGPGFLQYLGPVQFRTWVGGQSVTSGLQDTRLWGVEFALRPLRSLELGFAEVFQFGGTPSAPGVGDFLAMPFLVGDAAKRAATVALHLGWWVPGHWAKVYGQVLWDKLGEASASGPSFLGGVWLPRLGRADFRFEIVSTDVSAYTHPTWTQGLSYRGSTLGHPLGPDALGVYADIEAPAIALWWRPQLRFALEHRARSIAGPGRPERRLGGAFELHRRWRFADFSLYVGYQNIQNAGYVSGQVDEALAAGLRLRYSFLPSEG